MTDSPDHDEVRAKSGVEAATASARDTVSVGRDSHVAATPSPPRKTGSQHEGTDDGQVPPPVTPQQTIPTIHIDLTFSSPEDPERGDDKKRTPVRPTPPTPRLPARLMNLPRIPTTPVDIITPLPQGYPTTRVSVEDHIPDRHNELVKQYINTLENTL